MRGFSEISIGLSLVMASSGAGSHKGDENKVELDLLPSVHFQKGTKREPPFIEPQWSRVPSQELIQRIFPTGHVDAAYAELTCSLAEERSLENCRIDRIDPPTEEFQSAFLRLAEEYRLAGTFPTSEEVWRVSMIMRLRNDDAGMEACGIFCIPTPHPPPPPPPSETPVTRNGVKGVLRCGVGGCEFVPHGERRMPSPSLEMLRSMEGVKAYIKCTEGGDCEFVPLKENQLVTGDGRIQTLPEFALNIVASVHFVDESRTPPFVMAEWSRTPDTAAIEKAYSKLNAKGAFVEMTCSLAPGPSLDECQINRSDPATSEVKRTFLGLAREYRLAEGAPRPAEVRVVHLAMRLYGGGESPPCYPPFCVTH